MAILVEEIDHADREAEAAWCLLGETIIVVEKVLRWLRRASWACLLLLLAWISIRRLLFP